MTERPMLTITEAARAAGVDRRTIRRKLDAGAFPGAVQDTEPGRGGSVWRIPVTELLAAGFVLHAPTPPEEPVPPAPADTDLRAENEQLRRRAEVAEAIAEERGRALDDARLALRALTAGPTPTEPTPAPPPSPITHRRWWKPRARD